MPLKNPQDRSGYLKRVSRSDRDEKSAKANIQGVEIHLIKLNINGKMPTAPKGG